MSITKVLGKFRLLHFDDHYNKGVGMRQPMDRMITMVSFLANKPSLDEVAQFLVLDTFRESQPRTSLISVFDSSGSVSAAGSFGLMNDVVRALRRLSLWDRSPSVDAIRDGAPATYPDRDALLRHFPWLANHDGLLHPTVVWPLSVGTQRLGSLQMQFAESVATEEVEDLFSEITPILGLYLSLRAAAANANEQEQRRPHVGADERETESELTARQMRILHLLAEGMTNPQIAARIGFSDSTVRQETMAIYRFLGADGRRDAVHIAGLRGLLSEEPRKVETPVLTGYRGQAMV